MLTVCENINDPIGTLSTLKVIRALVVAKEESDIRFTLHEIKQKIKKLEEELEQNYNWS